MAIKEKTVLKTKLPDYIDLDKNGVQVDKDTGMPITELQHLFDEADQSEVSELNVDEILNTGRTKRDKFLAQQK